MVIKKCKNCGFQVDPKHTGKCPQCQQEGYEISAVINETMNISDDVKITKYFGFELLDPIPIDKIPNTQEGIRWEFDPKNEKRLTSFLIKSHDPHDDTHSEKIAIQQATRMTNLLSLLTNRFVYHKRPIPMTLKSDGTFTKSTSFTMDVVIIHPLNLELHTKNFEQMLEKNTKLNMQLDHYSNAMKAIEDEQYGEAVRRLCLSLGKEIPQELSYSKYSHLRNALSHPELINSDGSPNTKDINSVKHDFNLILTKNNDNLNFHLDPRHPKNILILKNHADILRNATEQILKNKLNS